MRIGLVAPPFYSVPPRSYGGIELIIAVLADGLSKLGHDVHLVATGDSTAPSVRHTTYPIAQTGRPGKTVPELYHVLAAYEYLDGRVDVIHDHTIAGPVLCAHRVAVPVLMSLHDAPVGDVRRLYDEAAKQSTLVAVSETQRRLAGDLPVHALIPHGLPVEWYPASGSSPAYLVWIGRFSPEKGVHDAIRFAQAAAVPLKLAGRIVPTQQAYFEARIRPLLSSRVEYVGEVDHAEKVQLLRNAIGLLNPFTWHEPFGIVMIEALLSGVPVIARRRGAAQEIVRHGVDGYLCDVDEEFRDAIKCVASLDRARIRNAAIGRFSAERMITRYVEAYRALLS